MKNKLKGNTTIKIFAILIAIILWLYVIVTVNPVEKYPLKSQDIHFVNSEILEANNLVVVSGDEVKTEVTIKTGKGDLLKLKQSDFFVYVDLSEIRLPGTYLQKVRVKMNGKDITPESIKPEKIEIKVDKIVTVKRDLAVHTSGKVKDGFYTNASMIHPEKEKISIKGAESVLEKIYNGVVSIPLNGRSSDFSENFNVTLVGQDGEVVTSELVTILDENVKVNGTVYKKKSVPVAIKGIPENVNYTLKPAEIEIAGPVSIIDNTESITVDNFRLKNKEVGHEEEITVKIPSGTIRTDEINPKIIIKE